MAGPSQFTRDRVNAAVTASYHGDDMAMDRLLAHAAAEDPEALDHMHQLIDDWTPTFTEDDRWTS